MHTYTYIHKRYIPSLSKPLEYRRGDSRLSANDVRVVGEELPIGLIQKAKLVLPCERKSTEREDY